MERDKKALLWIVGIALLLLAYMDVYGTYVIHKPDNPCGIAGDPCYNRCDTVKLCPRTWGFIPDLSCEALKQADCTACRAQQSAMDPVCNLGYQAIYSGWQTLVNITTFGSAAVGVILLLWVILNELSGSKTVSRRRR